MSWDNRADLRGDLRADPGIAPGERGIEYRPRRSVWPAIAVVAAAAAFGGVIWFAYQNGRDTSQSGAPPLVKADPSPVKIKPDQPGGQEIPFQDSTVYDKLDQNGQKPVMEKILPPPEAPVTRPPVQAAVPPPAPPPAAVADAPPAPDTASPTALAPVPGSAIITQPPKTAVTPPVAATKAAAPPPTSIAALESRALAEMAEKPPAKGAGAYRIKISAVRTPDAVQPEWARLKHRYGDILGGLSVTSSKTTVAGKGDFYRLEAGPLDQAAAKSACDRLRGQGLGCVVVKP
jgi:hypothetical protein